MRIIRKYIARNKQLSNTELKVSPVFFIEVIKIGKTIIEWDIFSLYEYINASAVKNVGNMARKQQTIDNKLLFVLYVTKPIEVTNANQQSMSLQTNMLVKF